MDQSRCSVEACERPSRSRNWCAMHYERWRRTGSPDDRKAASCQVDDCERQAETRGWCARHYERWRIHGDPLAGRIAPDPTRVCKVDGCELSAKARGWCQKHYSRWQAHGDPLAGRARYAQGTLCEVDGCVEPVRSNGFCKRHHQKWFKTGDPLIPDRYTRRGAPLSERIQARIAKTDACWFWLGHLSRDGYGTISVNGKHIGAHRASYMAYVGPIPPGLVVDHRCRNRACVNPDHLEPVTHTENVRRGDSAVRQSHCGSGHEYTPENTRWIRQCVTCHQEARDRYQQRKKNR